MSRHPNAGLTDADIGRLLAQMPDPPPPSADLTDRIVANVIAANAARPRRFGRRIGRRIWWAITILAAAGAVTAAAAAGRFEFARVLEWPQEIVRAAGWAPHHPRRPLFVRAARAAPSRPEAPAFIPPVAAAPHPLAPLAADRGERVAQIGQPRPQRSAGDHPLATRPLRALVRLRPEARFADEHRRAPARLDVTRTERAEDHPAFAAPAARLSPPVEAGQPQTTHEDVDRTAKDDALRFHDADEYARRQATADRGWRAHDNVARRDLAADAGNRPWGADRGDRPWAANRDHPWAKPQGWGRRADNRPFHQFKAHPPRGRRRG